MSLKRKKANPSLQATTQENGDSSNHEIQCPYDMLRSQILSSVDADISWPGGMSMYTMRPTPENKKYQEETGQTHYRGDNEIKSTFTYLTGWKFWVCTLAIPLLALASSIASPVVLYMMESRAYSAAVKESLFSKTQLELQIDESIAEAKVHYNEADFDLRLLPLRGHDDERAKKKATLQIRREILANIYEKACALYNDNSINTERFERLYKKQINEWVQSDEIKDLYGPLNQTYAATKDTCANWATSGQ